MKKILTLSKLAHSEGATFSWLSPTMTNGLELRMDTRDFTLLERPGYLRVTIEVVTADDEANQRRIDQVAE